MMNKNGPKRQKHRASDPGNVRSYRRINILIREDQYAMIHEKQLSLSPLIRDLLDDRFASDKVVFNLSSDAKRLYDVLVGNFGVGDMDLEPFFIKSIEQFLEKKLRDLGVLLETVKKNNR